MSAPEQRFSAGSEQRTGSRSEIGEADRERPLRARLAGRAALVSTLVLPFCIFPVFGRISTSQVYCEPLFGFVLLLILASAPTKAPKGEWRAFDWTRLDTTVLIWTLLPLLLAGWSSWGRGGALAFPAWIGLFYFGWRRAATDPERRLGGWMFWGFTALGAVLGLQGVLAACGLNPLALLPGAAANASEQRAALLTLVGHPNYLGSALVPLIFLQVALAGAMLDRGRVMARCLVAGIVALELAAIIAVGARGATIALVGAALYLVLRAVLQRFQTREAIRDWLPIGAIALLVGVLALVFLGALQRLAADPSRIPELEHGQSLASRVLSHSEVTTRLQSYLVAVGLFTEHPFVGTGPQTFDAAYWDFLRRHVETGLSERSPRPPLAVAANPFFLRQVNALNPGHAHNEFLNAAAELGLGGIVTLAFLLCAALGAALRGGRPLLAAGMVAVAVDAQFNFPLHLPLSGMLIACLLAACAAPPWEPAISPLRDPREWRPTIARRVDMFLLLGFIIAIMTGAVSLSPLRFLAPLKLRQAERVTEYEQIYDALRKAIRWDRDYLEGHRKLTDLAIGAGRGLSAVAQAEELVDLSSHPYHLFRLAESWRLYGDPAKAGHFFDLAARLAPEYLPAAERQLSNTLDLYARRPPGDRVAAIQTVLGAVDHLRAIDDTHPLADYAEAILARDQRAGPAAARSLRQGIATAADRIARANEHGLSPSEVQGLEFLRSLLQDELDRLIGARPADAREKE